MLVNMVYLVLPLMINYTDMATIPASYRLTNDYLVGWWYSNANVLPMTAASRIAPTGPPRRFCEARRQWPPSLCHPLDRWDSIGDVTVKRMDYPMVSHGKQTNNYGKSLCFMGKSENLMIIFHI